MRSCSFRTWQPAVGEGAVGHGLSPLPRWIFPLVRAPAHTAAFALILVTRKNLYLQLCFMSAVTLELPAH